MTALLNDLIRLARLEAGRERRTDERFDAGQGCCRELCTAMQPFAADRGLALVADGPATLAVEGDRVNTYRIAQNLLVNALKYTERGGVKVTWEPDPTDPGWRWLLSVQDTGPGLPARSSAPFARALKAATDDAQAVGEQADADVNRPASSVKPFHVSINLAPLMKAFSRNTSFIASASLLWPGLRMMGRPTQ